MADLPGLIEGAHEGVDLDMSSCVMLSVLGSLFMSWICRAPKARDPFEDWLKINDELKLYNAKLARRPQIVAANKMDMPESEANLAAVFT